MDFTNEKCVMLIDDSLPLGLIEFPIPILKAPPERIKAIRAHRAARPIQNSSKRWRRQMKLRSPTSASPSAAIKRR